MAFWSTFLTSLLMIVLGLIVLFKNYKSQTNISFALLCLSAFTWLFSYSQAYSNFNADTSLFWFKIGYPGVVFIGVTYYHFSVSFLKLKKFKYIVILSYFLGAVLAYMFRTTDFFIDGVQTFFWGFYPKAGRLHPYFLAFFLIHLNAAVGQLGYFYFFKRSKISLIMQHQLKYLLLALGIFTIASIDFIPNYGFEIYPFGLIPATIFIILIFYSIAVYRLMDITLAITRTGIFIGVYSFVLGIPIALAFSMQEILYNLFGENWWVVPLMSSAILATAGPFLFTKIQRRAEASLFQEQRRYQATLRQASIGMGRIKDLNRLVNLIVHIVTRTVRLDHSMIYLNDGDNKVYHLKASRSRELRSHYVQTIDKNSPIIDELIKTKNPIIYEEIKQQFFETGKLRMAKLENELKRINAALVVPSFIENKLLGVIVLGEKLSRDLYSEDDLAVFTILANQAALAIENAQFYDDMKKTHEQLFKAEKMATIGTMADGLSHQINNRLHALGFIAGDVLDTIKLKKNLPMSNDIKEMITDIEYALTRVQENVTQGGEIVQGLLKYTRKGVEGFAKVELDHLVNAALEMTQFKIKSGEMTILREYDLNLPSIKGNFTQLQEVFFNLFDNAYDAMMQRKSDLNEMNYKAIIKISAKVVRNHYVDIFVEDNGIGIKDEDKDKLFAPFFTTKLSSRKGTGLGLYVIKKLIEDNHAGKVHYYSKHLQGTRVQLTLKCY